MRTDELNALLKIKYAPPAYAMLANVGDGTGANQSRWCDWLAMSLWPSRGLELIGIECKVSRADWIKELKQPEKAEAIARFCDRWYLAVGDSDIVKPGELPTNWGLLVAKGGKIHTEKEAATLTPAQVDRCFLAAILRRVNEQGVDSAAIAAARQEGYQKGRKEESQSNQRILEDYNAIFAKLTEFEKHSGISVSNFSRHSFMSPEQMGTAFRRIMRQDDEASDLRRVRQTAQSSLKRLQQLLDDTAWVEEKNDHEAVDVE